LNGTSKLTKTEKGETGEGQSQEHALHFNFTLRGLLKKNLSQQAKQSILHTTVMFYGDRMKMCEDFAPNFGDKRTGCCSMTTHHLTLPLSPGNF
jgi:hypothetical protein